VGDEEEGSEPDLLVTAWWLCYTNLNFNPVFLYPRRLIYEIYLL